MKHLNWIPVSGKAEVTAESITFRGEAVTHEGQTFPSVANVICSQRFSGGTISANIRFLTPTDKSSCDLIFFYDPSNQLTYQAGISNEMFFAIRSWESKWVPHAIAGAPDSLIPEHVYHLAVSVRGSNVTLCVDGIEVLSSDLSISLPSSQVGLFFRDFADIEVSDFKVITEAPKAFVVMQFSSLYNDVYSEVIKKVCSELHIDVMRIDEKAAPGLIISDITRAIRDAKLVIADISPTNANVFYEVGYAHALNKPTILIAEKDTKLPFDVSPFRTIFYENSIAGKSRLEEGLKGHITAALSEVKG